MKNLGHAAAQNVVLLDTPDTTQTLVRLSAPAAFDVLRRSDRCHLDHHLQVSGTSTLAPGEVAGAHGDRAPTCGARATVRAPGVDMAQVRAANPDGVAKNRHYPADHPGSPPRGSGPVCRGQPTA